MKVSVITIEDATLEEIGQGSEKQNKIVITIVGKDKSFIANKTNANSIVKLYGDDMDEWPGKSIGLFRTEVGFKGEMVESIRVHSKVPKSVPKTAPAPVAAEDEEEPDIPF
jgi:hypothetical protein